MITQICLDIDGVLVDWCGAVCKIFGQDPDDVYARWMPGNDITEPLGISLTDMWKAVDAYGEDFWSGLEAYPWCDELWETCTAIAPTILLTSPSRNPASVAGKVRWMQERFGDGFRDFSISPRKHFCARPGAVLIDDTDKNCDQFVTGVDGQPTGAKAIVFPQPWNSLKHFQWNPFEFARQSLIMIGRGCV